MVAFASGGALLPLLLMILMPCPPRLLMHVLLRNLKGWDTMMLPPAATAACMGGRSCCHAIPLLGVIPLAMRRKAYTPARAACPVHAFQSRRMQILKPEVVLYPPHTAHHHTPPQYMSAWLLSRSLRCRRCTPTQGGGSLFPPQRSGLPQSGWHLLRRGKGLV